MSVEEVFGVATRPLVPDAGQQGRTRGRKPIERCESRIFEAVEILDNADCCHHL